MNSAKLIVAAITLLATTSASAHEPEDYPTHERVEYVFDCMQKYGGMNYDNLYKCSCSIDYIASKMTHDEFITADTFMRGQAATGERPEILREGDVAESRRASLEDITAKAARQCYLPEQAEAGGEEAEEEDE